MDVYWPDGHPATYSPPYPGQARVGLRSSSEYGYRTHPVTGVRKKHWGIDLIGVAGGIIKAPFDGVVTIASYSGGYGNLVEITAANGDRVRLGHNKSFLVKRGQRVSAKTPVAIWNNTGMSAGTHCHYETIPRGKPAINPRDYMKAHAHPTPPPTPTGRKKQMSTAVIYVKDGTDRDRQGAVMDTASGLVSRFGYFPKSYADSLAVGFGLAAAGPVTRGQYDVLIRDVASIRTQKIEGSVEVIGIAEDGS